MKNIKIFGLNLFIFLGIICIAGSNILLIKSNPNDINKLWHPLLTPLLIMMSLGISLNFIGEKIPFFNKFGLGFLLCILVPSLLVYKGIINKDISSKFNEYFFNKPKTSGEVGIQFSQFFITIVIAGSILSVDQNLLKRSMLRFIPLTLIAVLGSLIVTGVLGWLLKVPCPSAFAHKSQGSFWDSIFFIFAPLTNGGTNLGINGFANNVYLKAFKPELNNDDIRSIIIAPLILVRVLSIFFAGLLYVLFDKTKYSGNGNLENKKISVKKPINKPLEYRNLGSGLLIIFALYSLGIMVNFMLFSKMDAMVYVIIFLILIKIFHLIPQIYQDYVSQAGKFMSTNFTAPILAGLGLTIKFEVLKECILKWHIFLLVSVSLLVVIGLTFTLAKSFGFYPLEASLTSGLSSYSVGGTGNIGIMSISHRMDLLPFAMIATRMVGPLMYIIYTFGFQYIYMN